MATYIQTQKYFTSQCLVTSAIQWGTNLPFLLPWLYRHLHGPKQELYLNCFLKIINILPIVIEYDFETIDRNASYFLKKIDISKKKRNLWMLLHER